MPIGNESNHWLDGLTIRGGLKFEDLNNSTVSYWSASSTSTSSVVVGTNGVSYDRAAIQASIDACYAAGGGTTILGAGTFLLDGSIVLKDGCGLVGQGHAATILYLGAAQNVPVVKNYVSPDGVATNGGRTRLANLMINGNRANQTVSGSCHGVFYDSFPTATKATNDFDFDLFHILENVLIYGVKDNGVYSLSRQSSHYQNVWVYYADAIGFRPSYDTTLVGCVAGQCGLQGFYLGQSSQQLVGCKSFYSGRITGSSGQGFIIVANQSGSSLVNCIAQDNKDAGFQFNNTERGVTLTGCIADSNSTRSAAAAPGFDFFTAQDNRLIGCFAVERKADGTNSYQRNAVRLRSASTGNYIDVTFRTNNAATLSTAVMSTSDSVDGNTIVVNNLSGNQAVAYAASITPDPYAGGNVRVGTLTGTMTINAPSNAHAGARISFQFTQDATAGRALTWNATYKTTTGILASGAAATNGQQASITFEYDGTQWNAVAVVGWH